MNLYEKLIEVRKSVDYLQKEAKGGQYNYNSSSQVLASIREELNKQGVLLIPEIISSNVREKIEDKKDGKKTITYFTELNMTMMWVNAEKPDNFIKVHWYGQGVDIAGEKGVGKALTYAEKYFILKSFNIPTDKDDPDSFQKTHSKPEPKKSAGNFESMSIELQKCDTPEKLHLMIATLGNYKWSEDDTAKIKIIISEIKEGFAAASTVAVSFDGEVQK